MKKYLELLVIFSCILFLCGFTDNKEVLSSKYTINKDYLEYEKLTKEEKEKVSVVPLKFINYYDLNSKNYFKSPSINTKVASIPVYYNLGNVNGTRFIPYVKDQGSLSLCWAFSSNTSLESYLLKKNMGTYNFSENQLDYVANYFEDTSGFGAANSIGNVIDYWFNGYSPVTESTFGSYFTTYKSKDVKEVLEYSNVALDVSSVIAYPSIDIEYALNTYSFSYVKTILNTYNESIKNHIMNNGSLVTIIYYDYYNPNTDMVYNDDSLSYNEYYDSAHAVSIIGWNDNYGDINADGVPDGAWLVQNSWGSYNETFYVSYFDKTLLSVLVGTLELKEKNWNNAYDGTYYGDGDSSNDDYEEYIFKKGSNTEKLSSVKIYYYGSEEPTFSVSVKDKNRTAISKESYQVHYGINTFTFDDFDLTGNDIIVRVDNALYEAYEVKLFTKNISNNISVEFISENEYVNKQNYILSYKLITRNILTSTPYSVNVYDRSGNNISSNFTIRKNTLINGLSHFTLTLKNTIPYDYFTIKVVVDSIIDEMEYDFVNLDGSGTVDDPFIIVNPEDLLKIDLSNKYFKLNNNLDMSTLTNSVYGSEYNNAYGWKPISFSGVLDGNNKTISNIYSKNGGLFSNINSASITNLKIENYNLNASENSTSSGLFAESVNGNSIINNLYINNSRVISNDASIFKNISGCQMSNVHINNTDITSYSIDGSFISNQISVLQNNISLTNIVINNSSLLTKVSNDKSAVVASSVNYNGEINNGLKTLTISQVKYNILEKNVTNYYNVTDTLVGSYNTNVTRAGVLDESYDPRGTNIILSDNNILSNSEVKESSSYSNYDLTNTWEFVTNEGIHLKSFNIPDSLMEPSLSSLIYEISDNNIFINQNSKTKAVKDNITVNLNLKYEIYYRNGIYLKKEENIGTGSFIIVSNGYKEVKYTIVVMGDVSGDGIVDISDVSKIADYSISKEYKKSLFLPLSEQLLASDVNNDNKINIGDVTKIAAYSVNPSIGL